MTIAMNLKINGHSPIPIRRQLTEQLKHAIETGGVARDQALPSIRELAGFLGINANTVARVVEDLKQSGYVEARRGKGVFVASAPPVRPSPHLRESFLEDTAIRAAALGMTADDLSVGVLSLAGVRPAASRGPWRSSSWNAARRSSTSLPSNSRPTSRSVSTRCSSVIWRRPCGARSKPVVGEQRSRASAISGRWGGF